jgi:UPF0042 nucleotide-binding protein
LEIKIITGMSGAGKTMMTKYFENLGYLCHDNFPAYLISTYLNQKEFNKIVFIVDSRSETDFDTLTTTISTLKQLSYDFSLIYLDCSDDVLINRFRESKKLHHLQRIDNLSLIDALKKERTLVEVLKSKADYILDTSNLTETEFIDKCNSIFGDEKLENKLMITCMSFGFKHGTPKGIDLLLDVRCFQNPYWVPTLKNLKGTDKEVQNYIMSFDESEQFLKKVYEMIDFLIPLYIKEGKRQFNIAFGCTGGHHRSVCFAEKVYDYLEKKNLNVIKKHINIKD